MLNEFESPYPFFIKNWLICKPIQEIRRIVLMMDIIVHKYCKIFTYTRFSHFKHILSKICFRQPKEFESLIAQILFLMIEPQLNYHKNINFRYLVNIFVNPSIKELQRIDSFLGTNKLQTFCNSFLFNIAIPNINIVIPKID